MMNKYAIRRAIIETMYEYVNPQNISTIIQSRRMILALGKLEADNEDIQDIRTEWNYLIDKGLLVSVPGYDDYAKLPSDIKIKLDNKSKLGGLDPFAHDERLYGPEALR